VQPVPAPHLLAPAAGARRRLLLLLVLLTAGVAAAGALSLASSGHGPPAARRAAGPAARGLIGGVPLQQARCAQWLRGSAADRQRTVDALAYVAGGATPYGRGATLTSTAAHSFFDRACASPIARGFLLYEIYNRYAAFGPRARQAAGLGAQP
jgi:hypothetical protein